MNGAAVKMSELGYTTLKLRTAPCLIEEEAEKRGDVIVFCPKFHPELSPIESAYRDVAKTLRQENIVGSSKGYHTVFCYMIEVAMHIQKVSK